MKKKRAIADDAKLPPPLLNALAPFRNKGQRDVFITMLGMHARMDKNLAELLHGLAAGFTEQLLLAAQAKPEFFRSIAGVEGAWPILSGYFQDGGETQDLFNRINLSRDFWLKINKGKRQWSTKTPEVRVALNLLLEMNSCRRGGFHRYDGADEKKWAKTVRKLPPFSRSSYKQWYEAALPLFHFQYDDGDLNMGVQFEDADVFENYWSSEVYKESVPGNPTDRCLVRNARALIRRDIKKSIKQAFRTIAPKTSTVG